MYKTRWITALCLIPVVVTLIYLGGPAFFLLITIAALLAMWECYGILFGQGDAPDKGIIAYCGLVFTPLILYFASQGEAAFALAMGGLNLIAGAAVAVLRFGRHPRAVDELLRQAACVAYIPGALAALALIRSMPDGAHWILFILVAVFAGDTGALYAGTYLGKHKLIPVVSPNKTVEGAIGGLCTSVAGGFLVKLFLLGELQADECLILCLALSIAGQVGDLFESAAKRAAGVKDSGRLLPGHGGLLDRIDALLFAAPVALALRLSF